jgi:FkbM family methyltransferase
VSYEPLPRNFADLSATAALSGHPRWTCRAAAVSARRADVMLTDSALDQGHSGWATVSNDGTIAVGAVALDDEVAALGIEHIDVLKMDIEGHEAEALKGMRACLASRRITHVFIELHLSLLSAAELESVLSAFRDHGYRGFILLEGPQIAKEAARLVRAGGATTAAVARRPFTERSLAEAGVTDARAHMWWTLEP